MRVQEPYAYHVLGCVYWDQNNIENAFRNFQRSDELACQTFDTRTRINNLLAVSEIKYQLWSETGKRDDSLADEVFELEEKINTLGTASQYPHHYAYANSPCQSAF